LTAQREGPLAKIRQLVQSLFKLNTMRENLCWFQFGP